MKLNKQQKQIIFNLLSDKLQQEQECYDDMIKFNQLDDDKKHFLIKLYLIDLKNIYNLFKNEIKK